MDKSRDGYDIPLVGNEKGSIRMYTEETSQSGLIQPDGISSERVQTVDSNSSQSRLVRRRILNNRKRIVNDVACFFAVFGFILMIIETELFIAHVHDKTDVSSIVLKSIISVTTVILIALVLWYHKIHLTVYKYANGIEDWRLVLTCRRVVWIGIEVVICAIHPIPGGHDITLKVIQLHSDADDTEGTTPEQYTIPLDVLLSFPMFLRFYLFCRLLTLHSKFAMDYMTQSIGAMNKIQLDFKFTFKFLMAQDPGRVLAILIVTILLACSWFMRACEMYHYRQTVLSFPDALWLVCITFLTVGYGDISPYSYCGRSISVLTGLFGAACTALMVAAVARKLELTSNERFVQHMITETELNKETNAASAKIIQSAWQIYKCRRDGKHHLILENQKRMFEGIRTIREARVQRLNHAENIVSLRDVSKKQQVLIHNMEYMAEQQRDVQKNLSDMQATLNDINQSLKSLHTASK